MYVAVKGGERAIDNAHAWLAEARRGNPGVPELSVAQIREQMTLAVDRVMAEGSLYDPDLAALAIEAANTQGTRRCFSVAAAGDSDPSIGGAANTSSISMRASPALCVLCFESL